MMNAAVMLEIGGMGEPGRIGQREVEVAFGDWSIAAGPRTSDRARPRTPGRQPRADTPGPAGRPGSSPASMSRWWPAHATTRPAESKPGRYPGASLVPSTVPCSANTWITAPSAAARWAADGQSANPHWQAREDYRQRAGGGVGAAAVLWCAGRCRTPWPPMRPGFDPLPPRRRRSQIPDLGHARAAGVI